MVKQNLFNTAPMWGLALSFGIAFAIFLNIDHARLFENPEGKDLQPGCQAILPVIPSIEEPQDSGKAPE